MRLRGIELCCVELPLVEPWHTAHGMFDHRQVILVRAASDGDDGWGECVAMAEPTYSSEYVEGAADVLRRHLIPRLLRVAAGGRLRAADQVGAALEPVKGHRMAKAALELAVLDAELREAGVGLADYLAGASSVPRVEPARTTVPAGVAVGIIGSIPELVTAVAQRTAEGYRRVKLKIHPGWDVEPVRVIRDAFGDELALQVDANSSYQHGGVESLLELDGYGLLMIEQPLGDEDLLGHAALARRLATPLCLDESITSADAAATAIALGACSVVNVKAGRVGGYLEAVRVHDRCAAAGVPVWCGGMLETGVGRAANLALASLPNFLLPGDLSGSDRFWLKDVTEPLLLRPDGTMDVPRGPGLGVIPDTAILRAAVWRDWQPLNEA